jgi:hypothetical protein
MLKIPQHLLSTQTRQDYIKRAQFKPLSLNGLTVLANDLVFSCFDSSKTMEILFIYLKKLNKRERCVFTMDKAIKLRGRIYNLDSFSSKLVTITKHGIRASKVRINFRQEFHPIVSWCGNAVGKPGKLRAIGEYEIQIEFCRDLEKLLKLWSIRPADTEQLASIPTIRDFQFLMKSFIFHKLCLQTLELTIIGCVGFYHADFVLEPLEFLALGPYHLLGRLQSIELNCRWNRGTSDAHLSALKTKLQYLPSVENIKIDFSETEKITDNCLLHFQDLLNMIPRLQELSLEFKHCRITDSGLVSLSRAFQGLTGLGILLQRVSLNFSYCKISDNGLSALLDGFPARIKSLSLGLACCPITDGGINSIWKALKNRMTELKDMALDSSMCTNLTDKCFQSAQDLPPMLNLLKMDLCFFGCKMTGNGVKTLVSCVVPKASFMKHLNLNFRNCKKISPKVFPVIAKIVGKQHSLSSFNLSVESGQINLDTIRSFQSTQCDGCCTS